jgi:class 3 adenylate cyclase/tetratricopeptide (TPR) repeat protein
MLEAERRLLTVMFCDLVGSTALSRQLDPEDLREVIRAYQRVAGDVIARYGGHVAQYLGDGILVYFGYPRAHDDDARRAVAAALDVVKELESLAQDLGERFGAELTVRIGVHTGPTVIGAMGSGEAGQALAIGATPNVAARLEGLAIAGTVVISETTARLVTGHFVCVDLGLKDLRGVDTPLRVYRVAGLGEEDEAGAPRAPLVGREMELAVLEGRYRQAARGRGRVVSISGEAGIGKSRLLQAFRAALLDEGPEWLSARCTQFCSASALHPVIELAPRWLRHGPSASPDARWEALCARAAHVGYSDPQALGLLGQLFGAGVPASEALSNQSPAIRRARTFEALTSFLLACAREHPIVLVFEDLQWADESTLEWLSALAERVADAPLMLISTARPELRVPWPDDTSLTLKGLSRDEMAELAAHVAGAADALSDEELDAVIARSGGNPLYVEELTRLWLARGPGRRASDLPPTLEQSLLARLDQLPSAKTVLQVASVIGRRFDFELLSRLLAWGHGELERELSRLSESGLLFARGEPPHAIYTFKHALIQDAAYGSLLRRTQEEIHAAVADTLSARAHTPPELLAHHYAAARKVHEAVHALRAAGKVALRTGALREATQHLERALSLLEELPVSPARNLDELLVRVDLGVPWMLTRGYAAPELEESNSRAFALCEAVGEAATEQLLPALWGLWIFYQVRSLYPKAEEMAQRLCRLSERSGDESVTLAAHLALGGTHALRGRLAEAEVELRAGLQLYDEARHGALAFLFGQDARAYCLGFLSWVRFHRGDALDARRARDAALAWAARVDQPGTQGFVEYMAAVLACHLGEHEDATRRARHLAELADRQGMPHFRALSQLVLGWAACERGAFVLAAEQLRAARAALIAVGSRGALSYFDAALVRAELGAGRLEAAEQALDDAFAFLAESDQRVFEPELLRLRGECLALAGEPGEVRAAWQARAREVALEQGNQALLARLDGPPKTAPAKPAERTL